ncbi:MAG: carbonic anhydrase [Candidatus Baltobacteraceae bacterium]
MRFNRAAFLVGSVAAATGLSVGARATAPVPTTASTEELLARLMAGNKRFVHNDFPTTFRTAEKRALLVEGQAPFAAILGCADSRVIPELVFVQGIGDLFVVRVAGNYPDDMVTGSLEYANEHLGTRLIMVLGHQGCGAVKAVYEALKDKAPVPRHLSTIASSIAPGIASIVASDGGVDAAVEANVRAAVAKLRGSHPVLAEHVADGKVKIVGGVYKLTSGEVMLVT